MDEEEIAREGKKRIEKRKKERIGKVVRGEQGFRR